MKCEEARKKLCHKTIGLAPTINRTGDGYIMGQSACEGSGCMAWVWLPNDEYDPAPPAPEYVGKDPGSEIMWHIANRKRKPPVDGYCGLIPRPEA